MTTTKQADAATLITSRVNFLLEKNGINQSQLSRDCKWSRAMVSQLISGERRWNADHLDKLTKVYRVPYAFFFGAPLDEAHEGNLEMLVKLPVDLHRTISAIAAAEIRPLSNYVEWVLSQHAAQYILVHGGMPQQQTPSLQKGNNRSDRRTGRR